jgi:hypothetical protein
LTACNWSAYRAPVGPSVTEVNEMVFAEAIPMKPTASAVSAKALRMFIINMSQ